MIVSLNKANKIRSILEQFVAQTSSQFDTALTARLTGYEDQAKIDQIIDRNVQVQQSTWVNTQNGLTAIFDLRNQIQQANLGVGINRLICDIARLNETIKVMTPWLTNPRATSVIAGEIPSSTIFEENTKHRQRTDVGRGAQPFVSVGTTSGDLQAELTTKLKDMRKQIRDLEEHRNHLNHTKTITLLDSVVSVLESNDLL